MGEMVNGRFGKLPTYLQSGRRVPLPRFRDCVFINHQPASHVLDALRSVPPLSSIRGRSGPQNAEPRT